MASLAPTFGRGAMTNTWQDIKNANVVVVMGGNAVVMAVCLQRQATASHSPAWTARPRPAATTAAVMGVATDTATTNATTGERTQRRRK